jgi:hypothetical protein
VLDQQRLGYRIARSASRSAIRERDRCHGVEPQPYADLGRRREHHLGGPGTALLVVDGGSPERSGAVLELSAEKWPDREVEVLFNTN